ncbi:MULTISPECIES: DsbA family oxidoreductase [unclassified Brenneria]|uniref:DsbA family oxidoreductase n=1 Tax=unclassified Brenneria TaxID=2634434 RepID=UPI0029C51DE4|nr:MULTISPECIES: DsbA family oxidoreductase [unclassified Brenneria]MDX5627178.1 DsbA family oxidoreductase [Brenneria sp. L3-3Z]MDX5694667.1 DsbA family oxidoreductase [Brenneria sp. L4-2C]
MAQTISVEIWSDLICPWCWIGKRRFERALADFPQRERVKVVQRAFRLMPGLAPQRAQNVLIQRLGSAERVAAMLAHVENEAAGENLEYRLAASFVGDTRDIHRLVKFAAEKGLQDQAVERFYRAGFTENAALFERQTQLRLMADIGLDRDACAAVLDADAYASAVDEDLRAAQARGGGGVPFFLIDGQQAISGAQSAPTFLAALEQAWQVQPSQREQGSTGAVCGPDGCR